MDHIHSNNQDMKIISTADCGNAPKKRVLKDFIIAFAKKDMALITEFSSKSLEWILINDTAIQGRENVVQALENKMTERISEIELLHIVTHGNTGAAEGTVKLEDNSIYSFCNVYKFMSGKNTIKEITSYIIKNE